VSPEALDKAALALPGATFQVQWGDHRVYKVGGKMFAVADAEGTRVSLKATEIAFEVLTESGQARPAPYMARSGWVQFQNLTEVDEAEMADWLKTSHGLVAARLTRAQKRALGLD
jgi:predicted DNA-binding protein (MmcQ/YjbR family)